MSKKPENPANNEPPVFTPEDIAKARQCFVRGQELAGKKNFDYAVQMYLSGLEYWPEAVDEGHKPCRAAALFRGPQKVGFMEKSKHKINDKDPKRAMLNAETLLSKDTRDLTYMEAFFTSAAKARFEQTAMWAGELLADAAAREEKPKPEVFEVLRDTFEEISDRNVATDAALAILALERAVDAGSKLNSLKPNDMNVSTSVRHMAGKLTILRGKYHSAESFRDSMQDGEAQRDLHDQDRSYQSDERIEELVAKAMIEYQANPTLPAAINRLVELLVKRDVEKEENQAIGILVKAYQATNEFSFKMRAEDIRIKQLNRKGRALREKGDRDAFKAHINEQLKFELGVYRDRIKQYPTDLRLRYEFGQRLFTAQRYDDAIPVLQESRNEPRMRHRAALYIGRCFYEKGYFGQSVEILREAIEQYDAADDDLAKDLRYWLGRSYEAGGQIPDALKVYGQLIQLDYNYRKGEVRKRIDDLRRPPQSPES